MESFPIISHHLYVKFGKKAIELTNDSIIVNLGFIHGAEFIATIKGINNITIIDSNGFNYNDEVLSIIASEKEEEKDDEEEDYEIPKNVLVEFVKIRLDTAGFDSDASEDEEEFDLENDPFWGYLRTIATCDKQIEIHTYGNKYHQYSHWCSQVQKSFNCLVINSKKAHLDLRHTRGTHIQLQKTVRRGSNFEKVAINIVNSVENENLVKIGVYCRAGHHRSVAMGEMLKKYVYKNAKIKHLTIHR